ncbi:uracil-DNA glycosylase [Rhodospirillales bacterium YIM 152171]|uniref:Type-5 uracil-DNA glycosylase n=1 Tax=Marinimicrococcus flavescens TaxID=3031815 RepID=A0AAP3V1V7_9PROT|nr:uracil-DNA glycosylase [Marinimicrococcus flavescens]
MRRAPDRDCRRCPRLASFREEQRAAHPDWHNAPVPSFGAPDGGLLVVGLAPGLRGANRTGRPFTGDFAGAVLYPALGAEGLSRGSFEARPDDGLELLDCRVTNAVRCVPPANKPVGAEVAACRPFLEDELRAGTPPQVVLALGRIAHDAVLRTLGLRLAAFPFGHGARHELPDGPVLFDTYHSSRYNVNTGRLTPEMFAAALGAAAAELRRRATAA